MPKLVVTHSNHIYLFKDHTQKGKGARGATKRTRFQTLPCVAKVSFQCVLASSFTTSVLYWDPLTNYSGMFTPLRKMCIAAHHDYRNQSYESEGGRVRLRLQQDELCASSLIIPARPKINFLR
jgi:hypothetical protein